MEKAATASASLSNNCMESKILNSWQEAEDYFVK